MTDPRAPQGADAVGTPTAKSEAKPGGVPGWVWPVATVVLGLLGVGALVAASLLPSGAPAGGAVPSPAAGTSPGAASTPSVAATSRPVVTIAPSLTPGALAGGVGDTPIAELADPAWVSRVAEAAGIPERALAAYAGAALEVAQSTPGCGLGWNTVAAIGLVETEHASLGGATLASDGTVEPAIIGIPLDGKKANAVRDTDDGKLDGDTTWDRAVGPMQFIPSTWKKAAQDGNRDGVEDINNIDDAALAAAVHLCEVGGDLTQAKNWIAAVSAYNPSDEYNKKVSEAATRYATFQ